MGREVLHRFGTFFGRVTRVEIGHHRCKQGVIDHHGLLLAKEHDLPSRQQRVDPDSEVGTFA